MPPQSVMVQDISPGNRKTPLEEQSCKNCQALPWLPPLSVQAAWLENSISAPNYQSGFKHWSYFLVWYLCSTEKDIYCCCKSLVYHWSTEACKHFWILCQDNKIAINITLPTAHMLERREKKKKKNGKRAGWNIEILQCIPWKKDSV